MRTAVDSSVLLDVFSADPEFGERSRAALRRAYDSGALVACDIVWAEVRAHFPDHEAFAEALRPLGVTFDPLSADAARAAGELWRDYCHRVRKQRSRVVADFLIGAHALHRADALLCRDRGYYREQFSGLHLIDPTSE
jgi:predicted nucleic acid-binding protein